MSKKLTDLQVQELAKFAGYDYAALKAIIAVESGGSGFSQLTGKILIQFEPHWFQKYTGRRISNGVENQTKEWIAFNEAYKYDPEAAMLSTSIGMMQVMGFNYKACKFKSVHEFWKFNQESEFNQVQCAIRFIKSKPPLDLAIKEKNWNRVAYYYNGELFKKFNYHNKLRIAYEKFKS